MIQKKHLMNYGILLFSIFFSLSITLLFNNPLLHVIAMWLVVITTILIMKFEISQPLIWFSGFFALYSTAYPLLYILGYRNNYGYSKENILLSLIALAVVLVIVGVRSNLSYTFKESENYKLLNNNNNRKLIGFIILFLLLILFACNVALIMTPFQHKNEMLMERNIYFILGVYSTRFLSFFCSFYVLLFLDNVKKRSKLIIISSACLIIIFSLITGERDAMFRFILIITITLFILNKISKKTMLLLVPIGAIFLTASRIFKYYFVRGEINESYEKESFIYNFLVSDFSAAGGNLQILINNSWTESIHGFSILLYDFISPFIRSGILLNLDSWFNNTFFPDSYSRAFTLVGQGYVVGGMIGVIVVFMILGTGIKVIYKKSASNIYWLVIYIYSIPTIISAFRSTIGAVTTGLVRIALISIVIHGFLLLLFTKKVKTNKIKKYKQIESA